MAQGQASGTVDQEWETVASPKSQSTAPTSTSDSEWETVSKPAQPANRGTELGQGATGIRPPLTLRERATNFARDRVENLPILGTAIGGMLGGVPGAAGGAAIGAGLRKATKGIPLTTQGAVDTATEMAKRGIEGGALEAGGKVAAKVIGEITTPGTISRLRKFDFKPDSIAIFTRAFKPPAHMPDFSTDHLPTILDELGQFADESGKPITTVQGARKALQARGRLYSGNADSIAKSILTPRAGIVVENAGDALARAKVAAIPEGITDPVEYQRLYKKAMSTSGQPLKIGKLNAIRQRAGAKVGGSYTTSVAQSIVLDENAAALDRAEADAARELLYDEVNKVSPIEGSKFREANRRLGSIIKGEDLIASKINSSIGQTKGPLAKAAKWMTPVKTVKGMIEGGPGSIDEDLAAAIRKWNRRPRVIPKSGAFKPMPKPKEDVSGLGKYGIGRDPAAPRPDDVTGYGKIQIHDQSRPTPEDASGYGKAGLGTDPAPKPVTESLEHYGSGPSVVGRGGGTEATSLRPRANQDQLEPILSHRSGPTIVATKGPAKGLTLNSIIKDPVTGEPKTWVYIDLQTGKKMKFTAPQHLRSDQ